MGQFSIPTKLAVTILSFMASQGSAGTTRAMIATQVLYDMQDERKLTKFLHLLENDGFVASLIDNWYEITPAGRDYMERNKL